jgi:hypothetical protein
VVYVTAFPVPNVSHYTEWNGRMINGQRIGKYLEGNGRASGIFLEEVRKYTQNVSRYPSRDSNQPSPDYISVRVTVYSFINGSTALCWALTSSLVS